MITRVLTTTAERSNLISPPLKYHARGELEGAGAARTEDAARGRHGAAEGAGAQEAGARRVLAVAREHVREARVVDVRDAEHVRHVEEVEDLRDGLDAHAVSELDRPRQAKVERVERVVEARVRRGERERLTVDPARRVQARDVLVQLGRRVEESSARV